MKKIVYKLTLLFLLAALIPIGISYWASISKLKASSQTSVIRGHHEVANIASINVKNYFDNALQVLISLSSQIEELDLDQPHIEHLIKSAYLDFKYFQSLNYYDLNGKLLVSSLIQGNEKHGHQEGFSFEKVLPFVKNKQIYLSEIYIDHDVSPSRPAIQAAVPVYHSGKLTHLLVSEIDLIYIWHLVNSIRMGDTGIVSIITNHGDIVASSDLGMIFNLEPFPSYELIRASLQKQTDGTSIIYTPLKSSEEHLLVSAPLHGRLTGHVLIEQSTEEAFFLANRLSQQLLIFGGIITILMIVVGYLGVRWEILRHLEALMVGIRRISMGDWTTKVQIHSKDEFRLLGDSLNQMTAQLQLQADRIRRQERLSLIGRIAGGLIHDLKHPIQNIRNWTRLLPVQYSDPNYRDNFQNVVDREFQNVDAFFSNLKDLTGDINLKPTLILVSSLFKKINDRFTIAAKEQGVTLKWTCNPEDLQIKADEFSMIRILSNLVVNALQATPSQGDIKLSATVANTGPNERRILIRVEDTGHGIPEERLDAIFQDFSTTKRKGLGLGLALTQKLVEAHHGHIQVESRLDQGTRFDLYFPYPSKPATSNNSEPVLGAQS